MTGRSKRRRLNSLDKSAAGTDEPVKYFPNAPLAALAEAEKAQWHGFCEIESEPVSP